MLERAVALGIVCLMGLIAVYVWPVTIFTHMSAHSKSLAGTHDFPRLAVFSAALANAQVEAESNPEPRPEAFYLRAFAPAGAEDAHPFPEGSGDRPTSADGPVTTGRGPTPPGDSNTANAGSGAPSEEAAADRDATEEEPGAADSEETAPMSGREASDRSGMAEAAVAVRLKQSRETHGLATYYHPSLAGRIMANGRPYDPSAMTAASNRWPLGTLLRVTYQKSITVEITDRGRFTHALDLSSGAFRALAGSLTPGVIYVSIEEDDDPE